MKILITGSNGMLATQVITDLNRGYTELGEVPAALKGAQLVLADVDQLDITDKAATENFMEQHSPDIVINCAAYTNVDGCESNQDDAFKVNAIGSRNLAIACENIGAKLVHVSTDYVFRGDEPAPRREYDMPSIPPTTKSWLSRRSSYLPPALIIAGHSCPALVETSLPVLIS